MIIHEANDIEKETLIIPKTPNKTFSKTFSMIVSENEENIE